MNVDIAGKGAALGVLDKNHQLYRGSNGKRNNAIDVIVSENRLGFFSISGLAAVEDSHHPVVETLEQSCQWTLC